MGTATISLEKQNDDYAKLIKQLVSDGEARLPLSREKLMNIPVYSTSDPISMAKPMNG